MTVTGADATADLQRLDGTRERYVLAEGEPSGYRNATDRPTEAGGGGGEGLSPAIARYGRACLSAVREHLAGRTDRVARMFV